MFFHENLGGKKKKEKWNIIIWLLNLDKLNKKTYQEREFIVQPLYERHDILDVCEGGIFDLFDQKPYEITLCFNVCFDLSKLI